MEFFKSLISRFSISFLPILFINIQKTRDKIYLVVVIVSRGLDNKYFHFLLPMDIKIELSQLGAVETIASHNSSK